MRLIEEKVAVGVGVGVGAALVSWWAWRRFSTPTLPDKWEEVGEVSELIIFPLKSARGIRQGEVKAGIYGVKVDNLDDRSFMVISAQGSSISCKQAEPLAAVETEWKDQVLTLKYPGIEDVSIDTKKDLKDNPVFEVRLGDSTLPGIDCGDKVASWLSKVLYNDSTKVRLVYKGDFVIDRQAKKLPFHNFTQYKKTDRAAYSDWSSYHLACQSSLDDLNSRLEEPILMDNFRPNIIVKGSEAFDENDWAFVKIGDVVLRRLKPCQRCLLTTIDPVKGKRNENAEPLRTLKEYQLLKEPPALAKAWKESPIFGVTMSIDVTGNIAVGDKVSVARASVYPQFKGY
ncbi:mitochondrial amidoxime reducing component 2-like [Palaemon carinicauda]|uniref:mitochondrial amidoxime reducing component 2-like n=1 Tax=Palaemon carinicauda TaxID=392227 RepID=UPI0035B58175